MIKAKELRNMKTTPYGEDSVNLHLSMSLVMSDIIHAAKDGREYHCIEGAEYYDRETAESCYVLDYLEDLDYVISKDVDWDTWGDPCYSTIISWE
tara:strand:+ start:172 stop:456 length:285 start_codon:yes stop_codon:yes gene_type:complete